MNCRNCSKDIPVGFTDCPWCGAPYLAPTPLDASPAPAAPSVRSTPRFASAPRQDNHTVAAWLVFAMSSVVVVFSAYLSASRRYGSVSLEHSAYFLGAYVGPYVVSAIIILGYYLISRRKDQNSTKLMAVFFGASFFAFLSLIVPPPAARSGPDPAWAQHLSESSRIPKAVSSRTATVWDAAIISLLA